MKITRVEQHNLNRGSSMWKIIDELCLKSKNIYNYANYIVRQEFINSSKENGKGKYIKYNQLAGMVKDSEPYRDLGSNLGQQTLRVLDRNWQSFFIAIKDWTKNPKKYLGRPKLPKYLNKNGRFPLILDMNKIKIIDSYLRFSWKPLKQFNNTIKTNVTGKLMQVRFIPRGGNYILEIVYEIEVPDTPIESKNIIGIDLGIDNFATISNNIGIKPIIINGRGIKSMNQYYNKKKASIQSSLKIAENKDWSNKLQQLTNKRSNKINNFLHNSSKKIIDYCLENNIDTIVIGRNKNWKQESNMSKRVNQNFITIPHEQFISKLKYKSENVGIRFIETEESYTSGTSFLDSEEPCKVNYDKSRRVYRGLFKSNNGTLINADLNGAYQIIKKVFPNEFSDGIQGVGLHPVRLNVI